MGGRGSPWRRLSRLEREARHRRATMRRVQTRGPDLPAVRAPERGTDVLAILDEAGVFKMAAPDTLSPELALLWPILARVDQ